jgi:hypothetical protein
VATVSVHGIERVLREKLRARGLEAPATRALDRVRLTDDGSTIYVHVFMRPGWHAYRDGDAFPLAFASHEDLADLAAWRDFLREARLSLDDNFEQIVRWLEGG